MRDVALPKTAGMFLARGNGCKDVVGCLVSEPRKRSDAAVGAGDLQFGDGCNIELIPHRLDLLRADTLEFRDIEEARRKAGFQLLVIRQRAAGHEGADLLRDGFADAVDFAKPPLLRQFLEIAAKALNCARSVLVRP